MNRKIIERNLKDMNLSRSYLEKTLNFPIATTTTTTTTTNTTTNNKSNTTKFMKINTNTFHEHIYANLKLKSLINDNTSTSLVKHQPIQENELGDLQLNAYRKISNFEASDPSNANAVANQFDSNRIKKIFSNLKKLQFNYDNLTSNSKAESFNGLTNLQENYLDCIAEKKLAEKLRIEPAPQKPEIDYICYQTAAATQTAELNESATENDCERNELDETFDENRLDEAIEKINLNESKFDAQLQKIEEKLKEIHANFERRSNKTLEKLDSYDVKMAEFQTDFYTQLDKIEDIIEEKIDDRMKEMNMNFEKRFEDFAEKLNSTLQVYLNSLSN